MLLLPLEENCQQKKTQVFEPAAENTQAHFKMKQWADSYLDAHLRVYVDGGRVVILLGDHSFKGETTHFGHTRYRDAGRGAARTKCSPLSVVSVEFGATTHRCSWSLQQRAAEMFRLLAGHCDFHVKWVSNGTTSEESHTSATSAKTTRTLHRRFMQESNCSGIIASIWRLLPSHSR